MLTAETSSEPKNSGGEAQLRLRSVFDLLNERFFVPSYQRGYRWTTRQVEALLDDLEAFQLSSRQGSLDAFYCLQPVVVRRTKGGWELVDGQQRLTTIFLILQALHEIAAPKKLGCYEIAYETRDGSAEFLKQPTPEGSLQNIDYHHIYEASQAIRRWFDMRDRGIRLRLLDCLTGPDGAAPNVRVIWYELDDRQDPAQAFVRLNVGRIPLTSAELIRALLLRSDRTQLDPRDAHQIPQDWDLIERRLQDDGYWYFLQSSKTPTAARIEYLFDVFVRMQCEDATDGLGDDPLATFLEFQRLLDPKGARVWPVWQEFKRLTQTLEDWYEDRALYHLVGFLVATAPPDKLSDGLTRRAEAKVLLELLKLRQNSTGTEFDRSLRRLVWKRFAGPRPAEAPAAKETLTQRIADRIEALNYGSGAAGTALLLFNIAGLLEQVASTQRFQFDGYKTDAWDMEHVRSVAEYVPRAAADRGRWLEHARAFVVSPFATMQDPEVALRLRQDIDALLAAPSPDEQSFTDVFGRVRTLSGEGEAREELNGLSNLVLLDMVTNRSYKNAIFPVKRSRIIALDKKGQFVPPATRNVFLKYYSPQAAQLMLWDEADQETYSEAIETTLVQFFAPLLTKEGGE